MTNVIPLHAHGQRKVRYVKRGVKMQHGKGWRLTKLRPNGVHKEFVGCLLGTYNFGDKRIAIFSVRK